MNSPILLTEPGIPLQIEFSSEAMEAIRQRSRDGLSSVPRVPVAVGGLLVGVRDGQRIRVLDSIEIPCSHSAGSDFALNPEETRQCEEMLADAAQGQGSSKVTVVGWYCSKTRGDGELSPEDEAFHHRFFTKPWQIAMVVRPTALEPVHVTIFQRDPFGSMMRTLDSFVEPGRPQPAPKPQPAPAARPRTATKPPRSKKRRKDVTKILLAAALAVVLAAVAFLTQEYWMPKPDLAMTSAYSNGTLTIRWNAGALHAFDRAVLYINDGGTLQTTPLDRLAMNAGSYDYKPKTERVTAKLDAGSTTALTAWFAPTPKAPATTDAPPKL